MLQSIQVQFLICLVIFLAKPPRVRLKTPSSLSDEIPIEEFASGSLAIVQLILSLIVRLYVLV